MLWNTDAKINSFRKDCCKNKKIRKVDSLKKNLKKVITLMLKKHVDR